MTGRLFPARAWALPLALPLLLGGGLALGAEFSGRELPHRTTANGPVAVRQPARSPQERPFSQPSSILKSEPSTPPARFAGPVPAESLVQYALAKNPEIQAARHHARSVRARVPQVASLPDPQLTTVVFLESIQTAAGPQEVAMSLSQKLPWFGKLGLRSRVAYQETLAAYARVTALELKVTEQVKRAYSDVYFLQRAVEVTRALEPRLEDVIEIVKARYTTGQVGLESVLQAEVELSGLRTRLVGLEQAKVRSQARLASLLHLAPSTRIEAQPKLDRARVEHTARLLVDLAESCQPALDVYRRRLSRDRASVALACRDYWPDVSMSFNWYEIGASGLSPVATGEDAYSVGVGVNLPIYRRRVDAAVREAEHRRARTAAEYAAARDQLGAEVEGLYAQWVEHDRILTILESEIVPNAQRALELSVEAYRVFKLDFEQLVQNYRTLLEHQIEQHRREALREQALASLERAVGSAIVSWPGRSEKETVLTPLLVLPGGRR